MWHIEQTISQRAEPDTIGTGTFYELDMSKISWVNRLLIDVLEPWIEQRGCGEIR